MAKIQWQKVFFIGIIYAVILMVIRQIEAVVTMKYYIDPQYFGVWSKLMMPKAGPPPVEFMVTSLIFSIIAGMSITLIYYYLKDVLPKNGTKRIFMFADLLVATSFIFFTLPTYLLFNIPVMLLVSWFVSGFFILTVTSAVIVKIIG